MGEIPFDTPVDTTSVLFCGLKNIYSEICLKEGGTMKFRQLSKRTYELFGVALNAEQDGKLVLTMKNSEDPEEVIAIFFTALKNKLELQGMQLIVINGFYNQWKWLGIITKSKANKVN